MRTPFSRAQPRPRGPDLRPRPPDGLTGIARPGGYAHDLPFAALRCGYRSSTVQVLAQLARSWTGCAYVLDTPKGIAADLGLRPWAVHMALRRLQRDGWIYLDPRPFAGRACYWLRWRLPREGGGGEP